EAPMDRKTRAAARATPTAEGRGSMNRDDGLRTLRYWRDVEALTAPSIEDEADEPEYAIHYVQDGTLPWEQERRLPSPAVHFVRAMAALATALLGSPPPVGGAVEAVVVSRALLDSEGRRRNPELPPVNGFYYDDLSAAIGAAAHGAPQPAW